jgi:hypothetical protein
MILSVLLSRTNTLASTLVVIHPQFVFLSQNERPILNIEYCVFRNEG